MAVAGVDAGTDGKARGGERVGGLEGPGQRQHEVTLAAEDGEAEALAEALRDKIEQADLGSRPADADEPLAARLGDLGDVGAAGAVHVDDRGAVGGQEIGEQLELGGEIGLHRRVVVHVVAAEIGEAGGADADAVQAVLVEAVARCFQRRVGDPLPGQPVELGVEGHRIGRGQAAVFGALAADHADGAEARRLLAGGGEDLADEDRDRGLAAGAGDGDEMLRLARVEARRHQGERPARLGSAEERNLRRQVEDGIVRGQHGNRPAADRLAGKAGAIGGRARQRREQVARHNLAAVGRKVADLDRPNASGKLQSGSSGKVSKMYRHSGRPVVRFMCRLLLRGRFSSTPARTRPRRPRVARPRAAPPNAG